MNNWNELLWVSQIKIPFSVLVLLIFGKETCAYADTVLLMLPPWLHAATDGLTEGIAKILLTSMKCQVHSDIVMLKYNNSGQQDHSLWGKPVLF